MKQIISFGLTAALLLACLTGCGGQAGGTTPGGTTPSGGQTPPASSVPETPAGQGQTPPVSPDPEGEVAAGEISREEALAIALENAGVPEGDAYNVKNETDSDNGIPLYDIEFETDYGDYDFEVAMADGRIVGADYEVDEEWLDALGGSPVTAEEAASIVAGGRQPRHGGRGRFHRGRQDPRRQRGGCVCPGGVRRWPGPLRGGAVPGRHEI